MTKSYRNLRDAIDQHFNLQELKNLCFDLGVDFDNLRGDTKIGKIQSLIIHYLELRKSDELIAYLQTTNRDVEWTAISFPDYLQPYCGLSAFRESDAPFFFGREAFTQSLLLAIQQQSLVAVIGPSGSGKSSVIFAGLIPHLRPNNEWLIVDFRPGNRPFQNLALALYRQAQLDLPDVDHIIASQQKTLAEVINLALTQTKTRQCLLVIDQFEELFTLCPEAEARQQFMNMLVTTQKSAGHLTILLTMRADFMGQATGYRPFADLLQSNTYILGPMTQKELGQAIELPAQMIGVPFQEGMVNRILDDLGGEPGYLPLLEFALTLLWEQQHDGMMTHAAYEAIGQVKGALAEYANSILADLTDSQQEQVRYIFLQLVQPGLGTADTRRQATRKEIGENNWKLVQELADKRLVVTNKPLDDAAEETVEIAHETLIQAWGRLRGWMDAHRRFREWQEQLRSAINQWQTSHHDESALLRGVFLAQAEAYLTTDYSASIGESERSFIRASIALRQREQRQKLRQYWQKRGAIIVVGILVIIFLYTAIVALAWQPIFSSDTALSIAFVHGEIPTYYIGSKDTGLYRSQDGQNWSNFYNNLPEGSSEPPQNKRPIRLVAVDHKDPARIFVHIKENGIYQTSILNNDDLDAVWEPANEGLTYVPTDTLMLDLDISGDWGTAVTTSDHFGSLYISQNGGKYWQLADNISCQNPPPNIRATYISPIDDKIYVGAQGGLYELQFQSECVAWNLILPLLQIWLMDVSHTETGELFYLAASSTEEINTQIPIYTWQIGQVNPELLTKLDVEPLAITANLNPQALDVLFVLLANNTIHSIDRSGKTKKLIGIPLAIPFNLMMVPNPSGKGEQLWLAHENGLEVYQYIR